MADEPKTVDAVLLPLNYGKGGTAEQRIRALAREFKPILGDRKWDARDVVGGKMLAPWVDPRDHTESFSHHTLLFPTGHSLAGQSRYEWTDRGDGVKYGTLVPDPDVEWNLVEDAIQEKKAPVVGVVIPAAPKAADATTPEEKKAARAKKLAHLVSQGILEQHEADAIDKTEVRKVGWDSPLPQPVVAKPAADPVTKP